MGEQSGANISLEGMVTTFRYKSPLEEKSSTHIWMRRKYCVVRTKPSFRRSRAEHKNKTISSFRFDHCIISFFLSLSLSLSLSLTLTQTLSLFVHKGKERDNCDVQTLSMSLSIHHSLSLSLSCSVFVWLSQSFLHSHYLCLGIHKRDGETHTATHSFTYIPYGRVVLSFSQI